MRLVSLDTVILLELLDEISAIAEVMARMFGWTDRIPDDEESISNPLASVPDGTSWISIVNEHVSLEVNLLSIVLDHLRNDAVGDSWKEEIDSIEEIARVWVLSKANCVYIHAHLHLQSILLFGLAENLAGIYFFISFINAQNNQIQEGRDKSANFCLHFFLIRIETNIYAGPNRLHTIKQVPNSQNASGRE